KTAYEMVSDWSSDVCSSDLTSARQLARMFGASTTQPARAEPKLHKKHQWSHDHNNRYLGRLPGLTEERVGTTLFIESLHGEGLRSEERRVGKEWRSRLWPES